MGFEVGRVFKLEWPETHFLHDALVRVRSCPIGLTLRINADMLWDDLVAALCNHIVEWDLERDGKPIDSSKWEEVMEKVDRPVLMAIVKAWQDASSGVTAPLDSKSSDGQPSPDTEELELSLPMEVS